MENKKMFQTTSQPMGLTDHYKPLKFWWPLPWTDFAVHKGQNGLFKNFELEPHVQPEFYIPIVMEIYLVN